MNIWGSFENQAHWWAKCCSKNYTVNVFAVKFSLSILHCFRETSSLFGERCWYLVTMGSLARRVPSEQLPRHKALLTGRGYLQDTSKLCFGDIPNIRSVLKLSTRIRLCSLIVPHCNAVLAGASKSTTDKLQRVLNAAARIVSNTPKYDCGLSHLLHDELHWLDVPQWVQYKLCATVHRRLQHKAPQYMTDCCIHTSNIARRQHLRSAGCRQLFILRHRHSMLGRLAFSVAGPAAWNLLPDCLQDPSRSFDSFRWDLKTFLFLFY